MKKNNKWVLTDDDSFQLRRKLTDGTYELYQITQVKAGSDSDSEALYGISHGIVYVDGIDVSNVLDCYGYKSVDEVKNIYGEDGWEGIVAECEFELDALDYLVTGDTCFSFEIAEGFILKMSGYKEGRLFFQYMVELCPFS